MPLGIKRPALKRPGVEAYRSWTFVLILGVVLTVFAMIDRGAGTAGADGSTGCQLEVTTDQLNVRAGPAEESELLGALARGTLVDGTRTVTDGFRALEDGTFVSDTYLTPVPGTDCG
ncbi:SH3 domain-containing protein [Pseudonocardia abyssalis]|uniref:SH3 domain-containing protein n=1 Tax=Pseudonocardia abyssalis TaxID=2792008 RepID=A0ABS6V104_9PSEU|nr:SH3 domain-containing protein [Pseudonocardia abyssalis]MBW0114493.1 SH3 domain-containing protein [Pseudonocardia abyssalis]MBW0138181.1 SH3 domain-containing protein [Pseudonocardia abyssalis]